MTRKRLGEILVEAGMVSDEQLDFALSHQKHEGVRIGEALIALQVVEEETVLQAVSRQIGVPRADMAGFSFGREVLSILPVKAIQQYSAFPLFVDSGRLVLAMADPLDLKSIEDIQFIVGMEASPVLASLDEIRTLVDRCMGEDRPVDSLVEEARCRAGTSAKFEKEAGPQVLAQREEVAAADREAVEAPVIRFVNLVIEKAVKSRASDIHIEPQRRHVSVRFRIDGRLREKMRIPGFLQGPVISRVKVIAGMDIAQKRVPQDGGIKLKVHGRDLDLRISTLPTHHGEKVVIRVLDKGLQVRELERVGLGAGHRHQFEKILSASNGMVLVTGPTGSGKSTTLHAMLNLINSEEINIVTVEDPVEYEMEGISQVQVNPASGLTFASALRSILRQDPDVVMIGEIRDLETAQIAFRAAVTGHLVLSTLHTSDTITTVTRLCDMGMPPYMISSAVKLVISQRLVRRSCRECLEQYAPDSRLIEILGAMESTKERTLTRGEGCPACEGTGFRGRIGIFEVFQPGAAVRALITQGEPEQVIRKAAMDDGHQLLLDDALSKVTEGITPVEEIMDLVRFQDELSPACPTCRRRLGYGFNACPYCGHRLLKLCGWCSRPLSDDWGHCPYCCADLASSKGQEEPLIG
ncbi:ATPase, T2SS/T4P/T4SS family [Thermodesulfobacteriota bacterium]